ncbi:MAG: porin, partial [Thiomonas sp.]
MRRTLLSLALLGACSSAAMAADKVQLYGIIDLGVEHLSYDNTSVNRLGSGGQSTSRIGVKGTEDLGGGLNAFFVAETGFCANGNNSGGSAVYKGTDQGAQYQANGSYCSGGNFMGRLSVLGLKGGFGTVQMGRFYSFNYTALTQIDPFGTGMTGTVKNIDPAANNYTRLSQGIAYVTPNFSGFSGGLAYAFGAQPGSTSNGQAYELNLNYKNGPILVGLDYLRHNYTATGSINPYTSLAKEFGPAATVSSDGYFTNKVSQIYGSYDLGIAKLSAMYSQQKYGDGLVYAGTSQSPNVKMWMLGATVPAGAGKVLLSYGQRKDSNVDNTQVKQYAIGYMYPLSKRTNVYSSYAHITNDNNVDQYVGDNGINGAGTSGGQ